MKPKATNQRKKSGTQRQKIIRVAARIMGQKGYAGTSMQEIADAVGIHKTTIFHYFKDKQELLLACMRFPTAAMAESIREILDDESLSPGECLRKAILSHILFLVNNMNANIIYSNDLRSLSSKHRSLYIASRKAYGAHIVDLVKRVQAAPGGLFQGLDSKVVAFAILGMCNWLGRWYQPRGRLGPDEIADVFWRMFVCGDREDLKSAIASKRQSRSRDVGDSTLEAN